MGTTRNGRRYSFESHHPYPLFFFAPPEIKGMIRKLRGNPLMTPNTSFAPPFDMPPLKGMGGYYAE